LHLSHQQGNLLLLLLLAGAAEEFSAISVRNKKFFKERKIFGGNIFSHPFLLFVVYIYM
jgi:hypothetical protein